MSYKISTTRQFEKSLKRCIKRGLDKDKLVVESVCWLSRGNSPLNIVPINW